MSDYIKREDAINALWKALFDYEDKTEKQFLESEDLDVGDWFLHRIHVQNMSDIDRQTILNLPSADVVERPQWISVDYGLPELTTRVLVYSEIQGVKSDFICHDGSSWYSSVRVTHWMPLPSPPEDGET